MKFLSKYLKNQLQAYLKKQGYNCDVEITKGKSYSDFASNVLLKYKLDKAVFDDFYDPIIKSMTFVNAYLNIEIISTLEMIEGQVKPSKSRMYQVYHRLDVEGYHEGSCPEAWYKLVKYYHLAKQEGLDYSAIEDIFNELDRGCIYRHYSSVELGGLYQLFHNCLLLKAS